MSALLKPYDGAKPNGAELRMLEGDAQLIVVAGSLVQSSIQPPIALPALNQMYSLCDFVFVQ